MQLLLPYAAGLSPKVHRALPLLTACFRLLHGAAAASPGLDPASPAILVQPRHRKDLEEALSLVQAFRGAPSATLSVGHSRMTRPGPCYFGLGGVQAIRAEAQAAEKRHEQQQGKQHGGSRSQGRRASSGSSGVFDDSPPPLSRDSSADSSHLNQLSSPPPRLSPRRPRPDPISDEDYAEPHEVSSPCQVIINALLSPMQERNLSAALGGREVVDRVGVILGEQEGQA